MATSKLTDTVKPLDIENKINEIIDDLYSRNIGEIVASTIPLTDAGLHLLDGTLISGSGSYSDFVSYMADLYADDPTADYFAQPQSEQKYIQSWTQPVLTSNGTIGVDSFAVSQSSQSGSYQPYQMFTTNSDYAIPVNSYVILYSENGLNFTSIYRQTGLSIGVVYCDKINVWGSNDGINYTELATATSSYSGSSTFSLSYSGYYKYTKIYIQYSGSTTNPIAFGRVTATATEEVVIQVQQTAEEWWQEQVSTYGVCGKFVYDNVNNTVRLPKYNSKIYTGGGTAPVVNNLTLGLIADLANITTSLDGYYYIVVATSTKTDIQVDIDQLATDLNGKADVDLTNISASASAKNNIISWGMPDYSAGISVLSATSSATAFTAPCDGYILLFLGTGSSVRMDVYINDVWVADMIDTGSAGVNMSYNILISKGSTFYATNQNNYVTGACKFYPMKGAS